MSNTDPRTSQRRLLRFSIRTILIATAAIALALAWYRNQVAAYENENRIASELTALNPDTSVHFRHTLPDWLHPFGLRPYWTIQIYAVDVTGRRGRKNQNKTDFPFCDTDLASQVHLLSSLKGLRELHASETQLTDASLDSFGQLPALQLLNVYNAPMTDNAVRGFQRAHPNIEVQFFD
jgi:hypothetical protein